MAPISTTNTPSSLSSILKLVPEPAQQSKSLIRRLIYNNLYRGNYKYNNTIYFTHLYPLSVLVILG